MEVSDCGLVVALTSAKTLPFTTLVTVMLFKTLEYTKRLIFVDD